MVLIVEPMDPRVLIYYIRKGEERQNHEGQGRCDAKSSESCHKESVYYPTHHKDNRVDKCDVALVIHSQTVPDGAIAAVLSL